MRALLLLGLACTGCSFELAPLVEPDAAFDGTVEDSTFDAADGFTEDSVTTDSNVPEVPVESEASIDAPAEVGMDTAPPCPSDMIAIPSSGSSPAFCIDANEVTAGAYKTWVDGAPSTAGQPSQCAWNTTFEPKVDSTYPAGWYPPNATHMNHPIRWVDWCDAYAYCKAHGKHMCGAFGGGPISFSKLGDPTVSAWTAACSAAGTKAYPYGATYVATNCNGKDAAIMYPAPVGSILECVGGYPGLHDMSGNVQEWEDSCAGATGGSDTCYARGGDYGTMSTTVLSCSGSQSYPRNTTNIYTGIRCCL